MLIPLVAIVAALTLLPVTLAAWGPRLDRHRIHRAGTTFSRTLTINNLNQMFANTYTYTLTVDRNWPGYPATGTVSAAALGSVNFNADFPVPDSATHDEIVHACITISQDGACLMTCCFNITVIQGTVPVLASVASQSTKATVIAAHTRARARSGGTSSRAAKSAGPGPAHPTPGSASRASTEPPGNTYAPGANSSSASRMSTRFSMWSRRSTQRS